jgi:hypothetical protein
LKVASLNPRFNLNNSALVIFDEMISQLSTVATTQGATNEHLEAAIACFDIEPSTPWVVLELQQLAILDIGRSIAHTEISVSKKRAISAASSEEFLEPFNKKQVVSSNQTVANTASVAVMSKKAGKGKAKKICRGDCSIEGCSRGSHCIFEHVKGIRTLSKLEKQAMREVIKNHNSITGKTGFTTLTADPNVVGV